MHVIGSLDEVAEFISSNGPEHVVIFDADNTLVAQGAPLDEFAKAVNDAIDRFEAVAAVKRVIVLTNGGQRGVPRMISRGNKPWTTRRRLGLRGVRTPIIVVGDQVLTDGLLAWRLGATLLHLVLDPSNEPRRQLVMRRVGELVARGFLRTA